MQQQLTQSLAKGSPPRLTGLHQSSPIRHQTTAGQPLHQTLQLGGFAATINAFNNKETSALIGHGSRKLRALSTTVIELSAINKAANGGDNNSPKPGNNTPAATGNAKRL